MDFEWDEETKAIQREVRAFLAEHYTPELHEQVLTTGVSHDETFARLLGERNWIAPEWPREGFEPMSAAGWHVVEDELTRVDSPVYAVSTSKMAGQVIHSVGPEWMKNEILPKVQRGEATIALGMSEPEAGSDVAAVRTRARSVEGGWVIDGQKMFTTNAHVTDYVFLLARTDPDSERHSGLTMFLVPTDRDGFEAQGVFTLSGERTNITYYNDLFIEDRWRICEVGAGWRTLMLALQDEHSAPFSGHLDLVLGETEAWAKEPGPDGRAPIDREDVRRRLIETATDLEVARLLEMRTTWMESIGEVPVAEGPMSKLFTTEVSVRASERLSALAGPDALRGRHDPKTLIGGRIEHYLRFTLGLTIYAGTSEIQRNIIAQRRCGLPR